MTDQAGATRSVPPKIGDPVEAAPGSDPVGFETRRISAEWPVSAWTAAATRPARQAASTRAGQCDQPVPGGPEGDVDERSDRNARSSIRPSGEPERPAPGGTHPEPAGRAAASPASPPAARSAGAEGTVPPVPVRVPASVQRRPPGGSFLDTHTERLVLLAQIRELDRRICRMDVLIRLLEADVERNRLTLRALGEQRVRRPLPRQPPIRDGGPGGGPPPHSPGEGGGTW
ncbi:hypothetical protein UG55_1006172 [Frankia sp. EI5c]|nr:hypothetical protein UG55_1006172 [Frankia sp. EI5c]